MRGREGWVARFWHVIDERLGLEALRYDVPAYGNTLAYTLGGITFFSLLVVGLTGVILAQFYHPHPSAANASIRTIIATVPGGAFVRNLHYWSAQAVMISIILHVTRVYLTGAYRRPREFNWIVGVGLLITSIGLFFTGTVLKWDQEGFEALAHNIEISNLLGALGSVFSPSFAEGVPLLTRLYTVHVSLLPLVLLVLFGLHVFYVRHFGIAPLPEDMRARLTADAKGVGSFLRHAGKILVYGGGVLLAVALLAVLFPAPLGPEPIEGIEVTKPAWPFLWMVPFESALGIGWLLPISVTPLILLLLVPLLDRGWARTPRGRRFFIVAFLAGLTLLLALTLVGMLMGVGQHLGG